MSKYWPHPPNYTGISLKRLPYFIPHLLILILSLEFVLKILTFAARI